jgi:shikimate dehydrogenase
MSQTIRRAAVLGKPIAHSLSPVMHNAGYAAARLAGWQYTRIECDEPELAGLVAGLGDEWMGLSLTMPLKEVALTVAVGATAVASALGAANTLVRRPDGWYADNTDAPGMADALRSISAADGDRVFARMSVLGGGGTARAALGAAQDLGVERVTVYVRRAEAGEELRAVAEALGVRLELAPWSAAAACREDDVVISTVPRGVADELVDGSWPAHTVIFDVVYHPWPTPLALAAQRAGCQVVNGLDLLLAQGVLQFERFTGVAAPVVAMREALTAAAAR